jgi:preprotein translocase subunit SecG
MMADNNAKATDNTNQDTEIDAENGAANVGAPSAVIGHLGLIKAMSVIMAVLIVAALVTIIVTIYSRLTASNAVKEAREIELVVPADTRIISASDAEKGDMLVVLENDRGQMVWRIDGTGQVTQKMTIIAE